MSIFVGQQDIMFSKKEHYIFFNEMYDKLKADVYFKALIYTICIMEDTRRRWEKIYDVKERAINPDIINEAGKQATREG